MRTDNDYVCSDKKAYIEFKQLRQRVKELEGELLSAVMESTQTAQVEKLRQRVAKLEADNQRLKVESRDACMGLNDFYEHKLAAAQLENKRLRSALEELACLGNGDAYGNSVGNCIAQEALREHTDTEALESYIQKHIDNSELAEEVSAIQIANLTSRLETLLIKYAALKEKGN